MFSELKYVFRKATVLSVRIFLLAGLLFLALLLVSSAVFAVNTIDTTFMAGTFHTTPFSIHGEMSLDVSLSDVLRYYLGKPTR